MGRIIAIDYGLKRCGIAVTDPLKIIASPLTTVSTHELMVWVQQYVATEPVEAIVVGWPEQANGTASETAPHIKGFLRRLEVALPAVKLHRWHERYTTIMAHQALRATGANKQIRKDKGLVDQVSAAILLQDFMQFGQG